MSNAAFVKSEARTISIVLVLCLLASSARSWESQCIPPSFPPTPVQSSVCTSPTDTRCASGIEAALGWQRGEHAWLAQQALVQAGLGQFVTAQMPSYYVNSSIAVHGTMHGASSAKPAMGSLSSSAVAILGARTRLIARPTTIPEFAQLPDWSYGLDDYLLANEHCLAANAISDYSDPQQIESCHDFSARMGSVNSNHWPPQAKAMYILYHQFAMHRAASCPPLIWNGAPQGPDFLSWYDKSVRQCEKEALVIESVAQHYLSDVWATGHMWHRWSSPLFMANDENKKRDQAVAIGSGMIHGAWHILHDMPDLVPNLVGHMIASKIPGVEDDHLNLPGRYQDYLLRHNNLAGRLPDPIIQSDDQVQWTYPGSTDLHSGGGDHYYPRCNETYPGSSVEGAPDPVQRNRMLTCMAMGYWEVYESGPKSIKDIPKPPNGPDPAISSVIDPQVPTPALGPPSHPDLCWDARATNRSMYMGTGITAVPGTRQAGTASHLMVLAYNLQNGTKEEFPDLRESMLMFQTRAIAIGATLPNGTDLATSPGTLGTSPTLNNFGPNDQYVSDVDTAKDLYYEYDASKYGADLTSTCTTDNDCNPGMHCQQGISGGLSGAYCVYNSQALIDVFRDAEITRSCASDQEQEIDAQAALCKQGGSGSDSCAACVEAVVRHFVAGGDDPGAASPFCSVGGAGGGWLNYPPAVPVGFTASVNIPQAFDSMISGEYQRQAQQYCVAGKTVNSTRWVTHPEWSGPAYAAVNSNTPAWSFFEQAVRTQVTPTVNIAAGNMYGRHSNPVELVGGELFNHVVGPPPANVFPAKMVFTLTIVPPVAGPLGTMPAASDLTFTVNVNQTDSFPGSCGGTQVLATGAPPSVLPVPIPIPIHGGVAPPPLRLVANVAVTQQMAGYGAVGVGFIPCLKNKNPTASFDYVLTVSEP